MNQISLGLTAKDKDGCVCMYVCMYGRGMMKVSVTGWVFRGCVCVIGELDWKRDARVGRK